MRLTMEFSPPFTRGQIITNLTPLVGSEIASISDVTLFTSPSNAAMDATIDSADDSVERVRVDNLADLTAVSALFAALPVAASNRLETAIIQSPQG